MKEPCHRQSQSAAAWAEVPSAPSEPVEVRAWLQAWPDEAGTMALQRQTGLSRAAVRTALSGALEHAAFEVLAGQGRFVARPEDWPYSSVHRDARYRAGMDLAM